MKRAHKKAAATILVAGAVVFPGSQALAEKAQSPYTLSGHLDLASRYYLRGITTTYGNSVPLHNAGADAPESERPALQWGVDLAHESGFFLGYWGSTINYSYKQLGNSYSDPSVSDFQKDKSVENDIYGGYNGKITADLGYVVGLTGYVYYNGTHANALETKLGLSYKDFAVNAQTLLNDTVWGNKGDTYWTINYTKGGLPYNAAFSASLGYYMYNKEGKYLGTVDTRTGTACASNQSFVVNGCYIGSRPVGSAFRHLILGISGPIGSSGFSWNLQGIIAGKNRFDVSQANKAVLTLSYLF